jgi:hypothetical protein
MNAKDHSIARQLIALLISPIARIRKSPARRCGVATCLREERKVRHYQRWKWLDTFSGYQSSLTVMLRLVLSSQSEKTTGRLEFALFLAV